jgi:hypothetical protein
MHKIPISGRVQGMAAASAKRWRLKPRLWACAPLEYLLDDEVRPLPEHAVDILSIRDEHSPLLCVDQQRLGLNCHFFIPEEIEFDLDPKDFQTAQQVSYLLDFMRTIGRVVNKPIILTGENDVQGPLFRYDPATNEDSWFHEEIGS